MNDLTHLDENGAARMVDVSGKDTTEREAVAEAAIVLSVEAFDAVTSGDAPKGDVLAAARIAGIMAAKKTSELIPLCHAIPIAKAEIAFEMVPEKSTIKITATVKTVARTGVEMEALTAASVAALTIYDMTKAIDKAAVVEAVRLVSKSGGKSGAFTAPPLRSVRKTAVTPTRAAPRGRPPPTTLMGEVTAPVIATPDAKRAAFRTFMTANHLRATVWAKDAGVPSAQLYAFLTGRLSALPDSTIQKLAKAARVRPEDMFR
jgi:molybdenum cofactor biosynthesis protein MoaC